MESIDKFDLAILQQLQADGRLTNAELAQRVGLSAAPCWRRVRALEESGFIRGYRAEIDTAKVGLSILAFVRMSITGVDYSHIIEVAQESKEVLECHRGTGGDSFIMKVAVRSVDGTEDLHRFGDARFRRDTACN
jgi:DNA-binding Lrp family transcriptional regulator